MPRKQVIIFTIQDDEYKLETKILNLYLQFWMRLHSEML